MKKNKKIYTIKDIAERAGVSIGTVDRAIHNRGRVAKSTVLKIQKIIREVGYKPNMFASRLSRAKQYNFAVVMPRKNQDNKYWEASVRGIEKAEKELAHYDVRISYFFYDRYSAAHMQSLCNTIPIEHIDGILIAPVLYNPVKTLIEKLPKYIPYVLFNTNLPELSPLTFIGQDAFQSGYICGKLMKMLIHSPGTIAIIITIAHDVHIQNRANGFKEFYKNDKVMTVKEYDNFNFKSKKALYPSIEKIIDDNKNLSGIFVTNVSTHYFAEFLAHKNLGNKIKLIGYDLVKKNIKFLEQEIIDILISQKPEKQGYEGIYALYRHSVLRESCKEQIMMPIDIIIKENLHHYAPL